MWADRGQTYPHGHGGMQDPLPSDSISDGFTGIHGSSGPPATLGPGTPGSATRYHNRAAPASTAADFLRQLSLAIWNCTLLAIWRIRSGSGRRGQEGGHERDRCSPPGGRHTPTHGAAVEITEQRRQAPLGGVLSCRAEISPSRATSGDCPAPRPASRRPHCAWRFGWRTSGGPAYVLPSTSLIRYQRS